MEALGGAIGVEAGAFGVEVEGLLDDGGFVVTGEGSEEFDLETPSGGDDGGGVIAGEAEELMGGVVGDLEGELDKMGSVFVGGGGGEGRDTRAFAALRLRLGVGGCLCVGLVVGELELDVIGGGAAGVLPLECAGAAGEFGSQCAGQGFEVGIRGGCVDREMDIGVVDEIKRSGIGSFDDRGSVLCDMVELLF